MVSFAPLADLVLHHRFRYGTLAIAGILIIIGLGLVGRDDTRNAMILMGVGVLFVAISFLSNMVHRGVQERQLAHVSALITGHLNNNASEPNSMENLFLLSNIGQHLAAITQGERVGTSEFSLTQAFKNRNVE